MNAAIISVKRPVLGNLKRPANFVKDRGGWKRYRDTCTTRLKWGFDDIAARFRRRAGVRKLSHRYYLIFYQVTEATRLVEIVRIWDGRQNPSGLILP